MADVNVVSLMPIRRGCASVNRVNRVQGNQRGRETRPVAERAHRLSGPLLFIRCSQIGPYALHRQFWRNFQIDAPFPPLPPLFIDFSLRKRVKTCSNRSGSGFRLLKIVTRQTLFWIILAIFFVPDRGRKNWEGKSGEKVNTGLFSLEDYCRGRCICLLFSFFTTDHPSQPRRNYSYVD